jgi:hypothetical protein
MFRSGLWVVGVSWLVVCFTAQLYFAGAWLTEPTNPYRQEARIGIVLALVYALPALACLAVLAWRNGGISAGPLQTAVRALSTGLVVLGCVSLI